MKKFDDTFRKENIINIAGVDEAGRGPLAGPVVAAAVIFDRLTEIPGINDSKKLSEKKREELYILIKNKALAYSLGIVDQHEIDRINILQASLKAMRLAVEGLSLSPDKILVDGNKAFKTKIPLVTVVKGDGKSMSIAAASIVAKVTRDNIMRQMHENYPEYLWAQNKGYPTKQHIELIKKHGFTSCHRRSFLGRIITETQGELNFR